MIYGYARVSTKEQDLESQLQVLTNEGCEAEYIFQEKVTGTKVDRPELQKLLEVIGEGDKLIVTKLDRLARSTKEGIQLIEQLLDKGVKVNILNMGLVDNTPIGKFMIQTLLAVAELERNMIVERTQEGKALAKQKEGFREGRPQKYGKDKQELALKLLETNSYTQVEKMTGISKSTLQRLKRKHEAKN